MRKPEGQEGAYSRGRSIMLPGFTGSEKWDEGRIVVTVNVNRATGDR